MIGDEGEALAWRMHDTAASAIDKADTKAGAAATVETAAVAVVLTLVSQSAGDHVVVRVLLGLSLIAFAVSLAASLLVVIPRLNRPGKELVPGEWLYFGAVRLRSVDELLDRHLDPRTVEQTVAVPVVAVVYQAKRLSGIAWAKHQWVRVSILAAAAGGVLAALAVLLGSGR